MKRVRGIIKAVLVFLIAVIGFLFLTFIIINLPFSHRFVSKKINTIFISAGIPVQLNSITKVLPWSVHVQGVLIHGPEGDTIVYAEKVRSGLKPLALTKKKLILKSVYLEKASVNFLRNRGDDQLNIAAAFSSGKVIAPVDQNVKKKPLEISVADAEVKDLRFMMSDSVAGIYVSQDIKWIKIETKRMSIAEKTILVKSLGIEGVTGNITLNQVKAEKEISEPGPPWNLGLDELSVADMNFIFDDQSGKLKLDLLAGDIVIKTSKTDLNRKIIDFDEVSVSRTSLVIRMDNQTKNSEKEVTSTTGYFDWDIRGDLISFQDVACRMSDYADTLGNNPLSGFSVLGLGLKLSDLQINNSEVNAGIKNLKFDLGNGFSLKDMSGKIGSYSGTTKFVLEIETANSRFNLKGLAEGNIFDILNDPAKMRRANLSIRETEVSLADLFCFKPDLQKIPGINSMMSGPLNIEGEVDLENSVVSLSDISFSRDNKADLSVNGRIENVFKLQNAVCDLKLRIDGIDNIWLRDIMKDIKPELTLPEFKLLSVQGSVTDSLMTPDFTLSVKSDLGKIDLAGAFNFYADKFSIKSHFDDLLLGRILNNGILGSLSGSADIEGGGIKGKAMNATAIIMVDSIGLMDYDYKNSRILCTIRPGKYNLQLNIKDPSVTLEMTASADMTAKEISGRTEGTFHADLHNLHFYNDTLIAEGKLAANLSMRSDEIDGDVILSGIKLTTPENSAEIKLLKASLESDSLQIKVSSSSDFFSGEGHIEKSSGSLGSFLKNYLSYLGSLIDPGKADSIKIIPVVPVMNATFNIVYNDVFKIFVPDTTLYFKNLSLSANSESLRNIIHYKVKGNGFRYKTLEIRNLTASLLDSSATLDLNLHADTILLGPQQVNRIQVTSHFSDWKSMTSISVIDKQEKQNYNLNISSVLDSSHILLSIPYGQLTLNGVEWKMDSPEFLTIDRKTRDMSPSVRMHSDSSSVTFLKDEQDGWKVFNLELKDVSLSSFFKSELVPGNPGLSISGLTSYSRSRSLGDNLTTDLTFTNVKWYDLIYSKITLNSSFQSDTAGNFDFEINTRLDTSEINIKGKKTDKSNRNINASITLIPVSTIQPFVTKFLSDLRGNISGEFNLSTKDEINNFTGNLIISKGNLRINTLNSSFRLPDDRITFTGKKMEFNNFRILDSLNNELLVDGSVDFSKKDQVSADLEIGSSNLQVLNRKEEKNASFYGDVFIDSKLSIRGPVTSPVLKGRILLAKGTDIYFRQSENLNLSESGKVLTFTSGKSLKGQSGQKIESHSSLYTKSSIESVIEIDPATRINIEISKKMFNIDMVIQGGGELNYNMLVNSQVNMNGKYEISEGGANLKMVGWPNKAFRLTKGGSIRWDGRLDDPTLTLEAINRVKSSYVNPVDNKERYVDFDVTLKISNRLSDMDVSFTINTQDQYLMSIINTLSPDEQMRQAITILLFETVDLPGISTSSSYMSEQVNQMVAAQLNSLTKTTIKGIDISFGIDTYTQGTSSGGEQTKTSLSYEVKRNLLNDRAKVEFSGIASGSGNQSNTSNTSLNNFSFEYRLDSASTKFLKVYNEHSYEDVFEGDVVKTGVGFTYRKNYPKLSDIWRKKEKVVEPVNPEK